VSERIGYDAPLRCCGGDAEHTDTCQFDAFALRKQLDAARMRADTLETAVEIAIGPLKPVRIVIPDDDEGRVTEDWICGGCGSGLDGEDSICTEADCMVATIRAMLAPQDSTSPAAEDTGIAPVATTDRQAHVGAPLAGTEASSGASRAGMPDPRPVTAETDYCDGTCNAPLPHDGCPGHRAIPRCICRKNTGPGRLRRTPPPSYQNPRCPVHGDCCPLCGTVHRIGAPATIRCLRDNHADKRAGEYAANGKAGK
jgi:hypothetical protein